MSANSTATGQVTSADGARIDYLRVGQGPALVLLHGSMETARSHLELAEQLADTWSVYLPDRRGRGRSGPVEAGRDVEQSVEDVAALVAESGAEAIAGVSSGAIICLHAARALPQVTRVVCFEPPLLAETAAAQAFVDRVERELDAGDVPAALVTGWLATELGPAWVRRLPRRVLHRMVRLGTRQENRRAADLTTTMTALAPTLPHEFRIVAASSGPLDRFTDVSAEVLLLGGTTSPAYLTQALDRLEVVLPHHRRERLVGLGHEALGNAAQRGRPAEVAPVLKAFLRNG